mgnify:CR=1 FL=1
MVRWFATMDIRKGNRGSKPNRTNDRRNRNILINNYKKDFYIKTLKSKSSKESIAELTPKKKGTNIDHIIIIINTTTWNPSSFKLYYSDRTYSIINLSKYATDQNFPDSTFVFNKKQYSKAELIDLR